jgi:uncharacterized protein (TIGR02145 family)
MKLNKARTGNTRYKTLGFTWLFERSAPHQSLLSGDSDVLRNPQRFHTATVSKHKKPILINMKIAFISLLFLTFTFLGFSQSSSYEVVQIGGQTWMKNNLNVDQFRNGDIIEEAITIEEWVLADRDSIPAWCYYENNIELGFRGKLYNFHAVKDKRGLAPQGFHIATDEDWKQLVMFYGGEAVAGKKIIEKQNLFNVIPTGFRDIDGSFQCKSFCSYYWTSLSIEKDVAFFFKTVSGNELTRENTVYGKGFAVRCIKDTNIKPSILLSKIICDAQAISSCIEMISRNLEDSVLNKNWNLRLLSSIPTRLTLGLHYIENSSNNFKSFTYPIDLNITDDNCNDIVNHCYNLTNVLNYVRRLAKDEPELLKPKHFSNYSRILALNPGCYYTGLSIGNDSLFELEQNLLRDSIEVLELHDIPFNKIVSIDKTLSKIYQVCPRLRHIDLSYTGITAIQLDSLSLKNLYQLQVIKLAGNQLDVLPNCISFIKTLVYLD